MSQKVYLQGKTALEGEKMLAKLMSLLPFSCLTYYGHFKITTCKSNYAFTVYKMLQSVTDKTN